MYCFFIRAHNSKGKHFDINAFGADSIMMTVYQCANAKSPLPLGMQKIFRSLNEMYLSFMDPNGEIILFELFGVTREVESKLYFKAGSERRTLVFQSGYGDDITQRSLTWLHQTRNDRLNVESEYEVVFHDPESPLDRFRNMYKENRMLEKRNVVDFKDDGWIKERKGIIKKNRTPSAEVSRKDVIRHEMMHKIERGRIVDFGHRRTAIANWRVPGIPEKSS